MPYIMQSTLLLLVPILFAITLYLTLSRVITAVHGQEQSPISVRWLNRETMGICFASNGEFMYSTQRLLCLVSSGPILAR